MTTRRQKVMLIVSVAMWAIAVVAGGSHLATMPVKAQGVNFRDPITCDASIAVNMNTITTTQIVALTAGQRVLVCGFALSGGGATTAKLVRGTGTNCGTGTADVTAPFEFADNTAIIYGGGIGTVFRLPAAEALCITTSAAIQLSGVITYAKF